MLAFGVASVLFMGTVLASSYTIFFDFDVYLEGEPRYFDGQNIAFQAFAQSDPHPFPLNPLYEVTLHREVLGFNDEIGSVDLKRDEFDQVEWSNVGPGEYYLTFSKANDGISLVDHNAKFYNY